MTTDELSLVEGGTRLRLSHRAGQLEVRTESGDLLDLTAAQVLMALGGSEPLWVPMVRGLQAADLACAGDSSQLLAAGRVLARRTSVRNEAARTSSSPVIRMALAAFGAHQVALNPELTKAEWDLLLHHPDPTVTKRAQTTAEVLPEALHDHPDLATRARVARNPAVSPAVLAGFTKSLHSEIQEAVAGNPSCPPDDLHRLFQSTRNQTARMNVARNPTAGPRTLRACIKEGNPQLRAFAVRNPALGRRTAMRHLASRYSVVRRELGGRPDHTNRSLTWLERMSRRDLPYWQAMIRAHIRNNPAAGEALRERCEQLDRYARSRKGAIPPTPVLRRFAPPGPGESIFLFASIALMVGGAVGAAFHAGYIALIFLGAIMLLLFCPRLRTVRADTRCMFAPGTGKLPTGERLTPTFQTAKTPASRSGRGLVIATALAGVVVVNLMTHSSPSSSGSFPPLNGSLPTFITNVSGPLAGTTEFQAVQLDAATPATDENVGRYFGDVAALMTAIIGKVGAGFPAPVSELFVELSHIESGPYSTATWNHDLPGLRSSLQQVASAGD